METSKIYVARIIVQLNNNIEIKKIFNIIKEGNQVLMFSLKKKIIHITQVAN